MSDDVYYSGDDSRDPFAIGDNVDLKMMMGLDAETIVEDYAKFFCVEDRNEVEQKLRRELKDAAFFDAQLTKYGLSGKDYVEVLVHVYPKMFSPQLVKSLQSHMKIGTKKPCKKK